jgi:hypothetical protein
VSAHGYAALEQVLLTLGLQQGFFNQADHDAYRAAWSQPGALTGSLNYYRANNLVTGVADAPQAATRMITAPTYVALGFGAPCSGEFAPIEECGPQRTQYFMLLGSVLSPISHQSHEQTLGHWPSVCCR